MDINGRCSSLWRYDRVFAIVEGDEELERFVEAIRICGELDDICDGLSITKQQAYNINKRLQRGLERSRDKGIEV